MRNSMGIFSHVPIYVTYSRSKVEIIDVNDTQVFIGKSTQYMHSVTRDTYTHATIQRNDATFSMDFTCLVRANQENQSERKTNTPASQSLVTYMRFSIVFINFQTQRECTPTRA